MIEEENLKDICRESPAEALVPQVAPARHLRTPATGVHSKWNYIFFYEQVQPLLVAG